MSKNYIAYTFLTFAALFWFAARLSDTPVACSLRLVTSVIRLPFARWFFFSGRCDMAAYLGSFILACSASVRHARGVLAAFGYCSHQDAFCDWHSLAAVSCRDAFGHHLKYVTTHAWCLQVYWMPPVIPLSCLAVSPSSSPP